MIFGDWSHEETEGQQLCARSKAWNLAKNKNKLKEKDQVAFYSPTEEWVLPVASISRKEFVRSSCSRTIVERHFEKVLLKYGWGKVPNW